MESRVDLKLFFFLSFVTHNSFFLVYSMNVEEKRNLEPHGCLWHFCCSVWDGCTCHSCRVVAECKLYEEQTKSKAPVVESMTRN